MALVFAVVTVAVMGIEARATDVAVKWRSLLNKIHVLPMSKLFLMVPCLPWLRLHEETSSRLDLPMVLLGPQVVTRDGEL